jgi:homocysteine S-methyltransferase
MERMAAKGSGPEAQAEGVRIAGEALAAIRSEIQGVQVSAAFGKVDLALEVMRQAGVL